MLNNIEKITLADTPLSVEWLFFFLAFGLYTNAATKDENTIASITPVIGIPMSLLANSIKLPMNNPKATEDI